MTDPDRPVTRRELREELEWFLKIVATKDDLKGFAREESLKAYATKDDLLAVRDELRTHFSVVCENFKEEFKNLYDWTLANVNGVVNRVDAIETGHGTRLDRLEIRVTALESPSDRK